MSTITKNELNPFIWHWHTVTTAGPFWPPATRKVSPFQKDIPLLSYPYYALPPAIQLHLPTASSLNTCATVIYWQWNNTYSRVVLKHGSPWECKIYYIRRIKLEINVTSLLQYTNSGIPKERENFGGFAVNGSIKLKHDTVMWINLPQNMVKCWGLL